MPSRRTNKRLSTTVSPCCRQTRGRGRGVAIPVFSLRSENSFGVGEFEDLKLLADWGRQAGLKLIQILPVNDTTATHTWADSYPYAAISAFALHPIYLNLNRRRQREEQEAARPHWSRNAGG